MTAATRLPITAIIASHNEAHLLERCLPPLQFCDEIVVIDIDSSDNTAAVAEAHGARVVRHPWVPIAELARVDVVPSARHDWLLIRDPDEIVPTSLAAETVELFGRLDPDVGIVAAPTQRYFGDRALKGGTWGGVKRDRLLAKRGAVEFPAAVHRRLIRKPGYREQIIPFRGDNAIAHFWVDGYRMLIKRHLRYLKLEGPDRADSDEITGWRAVVATPWRSFYQSFIRENGFRDGPRGFALSIIWSVYRTGSELMLLRELRRRRRG